MERIIIILQKSLNDAALCVHVYDFGIDCGNYEIPARKETKILKSCALLKTFELFSHFVKLEPQFSNVFCGDLM